MSFAALSSPIARGRIPSEENVLYVLIALQLVVLLTASKVVEAEAHNTGVNLNY